MPIRNKSRKTRKTAASRKNVPAEISPADVSLHEEQAARHAQSERAWQSLTAGAPDEEDRWSTVEEGLLARDQGRNQSLRRWKYFAK